MSDVLVYSTRYCPYCVRAKALLERHHMPYREIMVDEDDEQRDIMLAKSNGRQTVPQIFINDEHIGGYDDLKIWMEKNRT